MILSASDLNKTFIYNEILTDISFNVDKGDKIGVIGINGAGKSTLFKILNNEMSYDSGTIYKIKNMRIGYLKQNVHIDSDRSVKEVCLDVFSDVLKAEKKLREMEKEMGETTGKDLENLVIRYHDLLEYFEEHSGYSYKSEIKGALKGLGFSEDEFSRPVNTFSGGEKSRIALARLILKKPDLLLLDEPTNHLDLDGIEFLEGFVRDFPNACMIISHDRYFLDHTVNRIFHIENHRLKVYETDYTGFQKQRKKYLDIVQKTYENQQKEIKRQEEIIDRYMNYGNEKLIRQGRSRKKLLDKMKTEERPETDQTDIDLNFIPPVRSGDDVLFVEDLKKSFDRLLFKDVNFKIYRGEKVGLIGKNGIGKTTLFKIILHEILPDEGRVLLGENVHIGYFDQEQSCLHDEKTVIDEIWDDFVHLTHFEIRKYLARMNFTGDDIFKPVGELSGGEKARLSILKMILSESNFFLMDEPTNHLDIDSKEVLEDALIDYEGTVFVISHDRYFLNKVADKIIELKEDGATEYLGNYDYYAEKIREKEEEFEELPVNKTELQKKKKKKRKTIRENKKRRRQIEELEDEITEKEERIEELYRVINEKYREDPSFNPTEYYKEVSETEKSLDDLYKDWEELTMMTEA